MYAKTVLIQTEVSEGRAVIAHFLQLIYDDAGNEMARAKDPHTVCLLPDADLDITLTAINRDITTREGIKWAAIEASEWERVTGHCAVEHTPEIKVAYAQYIEKAKAARNLEILDSLQTEVTVTEKS